MFSVDERGLPKHCFVCLKTTNEVVMIARDQKGYLPVREGNEPLWGQETADLANKERGINKAQSKAMEMGSMFGWDTPAANPAMYDEETGLPKK
ncbi:hypothetical protein [Paenibacillus agilis]|uniref:Uncharacterized protein n=1 Tax=Paenibacillus agilis TaxID=3020863 RepID=A0A559IEG1_9BACL|nr:hypothetical protein [Paenibacillus agilis]TVX86036.1 hypothetical protein FPZ44_24140 [Paenibacillus agilis]